MTTLSYPGSTTVYIQDSGGGNILYSTDQVTWSSITTFPVTLINSNTTSGLLQLNFITDIQINDNNFFFICGSSHLQFGSTSLNPNGSRPIISIGVDNYDGFIANGSQIQLGYDNVYVYNLFIDSGGHTTQIGGGWIGHTYFGNGATNNYIINCSSNGDLPTGTSGSGGILGSNAGNGAGAELSVIGCSSYGAIGNNCGGIVGSYAGNDGGNVTCEQCWSEGQINNGAGGIFGIYAGINGTTTAENCYSTGIINDSAGGIFGQYTAYNRGSDTNANAQAINCYSSGLIDTNAGGIFGADSGFIGGFFAGAGNCYSSGVNNSGEDGIFGARFIGVSNNIYVANGNWSSIDANSNLTGVPVSPNNIGTTWISNGVNQPYELRNMGFSPYSIQNINFDIAPSLNTSYIQNIEQGQTTNPYIFVSLSGSDISIIEINGMNPSSFSTISINSTTGVISTAEDIELGTYNILLRNSGSYNISSFQLTVSPLLGLSSILSICCKAPFQNILNLPYNTNNTSGETQTNLRKGQALITDFATNSRAKFTSYSDYYKYLQTLNFRK